MLLWYKYIIVLLLCGLVLLPRIFDLGAFKTADEKRWATNVGNFVEHLAFGEFGETLRQPHPGLTTQWFGAPTIHSPSWAVRKLPLVLSQSILVLLIGYVFYRLWGRWAGILSIVLLAVSPPLVAHTRVYAMDSLLALFFLLSVALLLLWERHQETRYLVAAGAAAALATLSKLPGSALVPLALLWITYVWWRATPRAGERLLKNYGFWLAAFLIVLPLVLPALFIHPWATMQEVLSFFASDNYLEEHPASPWYYFLTLVFSSTPLQMVGLASLPWVLFGGLRHRRITRSQLLFLLLCGIVFFVGMSLGAKKGDRYILPVFLLVDMVTLGAILSLLTARSFASRLIIALMAIALVWQGLLLWQLHPYALAYVNPLTKPWLADRRMGWGEGLDLAAAYLNTKPNAEKLKVAAYYSVEFSYRFKGESIPVHQYDAPNVDYVVAYRAMLERGPDAWETDVLQQLQSQTPEKIITINGIPYIWIYAR